LAYLVLARKWRPQRFEDIVGQDSIVTILKNAILQDRIAHAYLFSGPRGVGKTTTARILAKALNCEKGPTPQPCNTCNTCLSIIEGYSVDVIEIDGASNNSVDNIRELRETVKYVPSSGQYKIYIIDEAHMLSQSAFNALLKTLEEPPSHVVFVLATTAPHKIPVTVHSRCQHLPFKRVSPDVIRKHLNNIINKEKIKITQQALNMIVRAADGSLRDALTLLDQIYAFTDNITERQVQDLLGITDISFVIRIVETLINGDKKELLKSIEQLYEIGADFKEFINALINFIRSMLVVKITGNFNNIEISDIEKEYIKKTLPKLTEEEIFLILSEVVKTENDLRISFSTRIAFEIGMLRASMIKNLKPVKEVIKKLQHIIDTFSNKSLQNSSDVKIDVFNNINDNINNNLEEFNDKTWNTIISKIEKDFPALASKIMHAKPRVERDKLILYFNGGHSIHADAVKKQVDKIEMVLKEISGDKIKEIIIKSNTSKTKTLIKNDEEFTPDEEKVLKTFGGRIIERRKINV